MSYRPPGTGWGRRSLEEAGGARRSSVGRQEELGGGRRSMEEQCWVVQVLAAALGSHLLAVGQKSQIRLSRDIKRTICKVGLSLLVAQLGPGQAPTGLDSAKFGCLLAVVQNS